MTQPLTSTQTSPASDGAGRRGAYDPSIIEPVWQARWQETGIYNTDLRGAEHPFYNLMMFPYPSAEGLHVGNVYAFTGSDIYGRFTAMRGYDVFEPMGFDAFGIHSENFAIKRGEHPKTLTARNVERFRETQLKRIGNRFDWQHEVQTTDPNYYKWTQWIFLQLYRAGLAVRKKAAVNWCPTDLTVLADEQVINGRCERCGTPVVQRDLEQWFFRITEYAQRLLDHLDWLDWSDVVKVAQRNWIGRSEGVEFTLGVEGHPAARIDVFTTRVDTVFGMTYVVLAPEHPLVDSLTTPDRRAAVEAYREQARLRTELERLSGQYEKTGEFIGSYAINPANDERVPIWIADYVLATYGTGAIMAVPASDERDWEFARRFGLPIRVVVRPPDAPDDITADELPGNQAYVADGVMVNSGRFNGLPNRVAMARIADWFEERGLGQRRVNYRLRDWLISRQRYWGTPIPIIYCPTCGTVPVPEEDLPVLLPDVADWTPKGTGASPLADVPEFVNTTCPRCGEPARRETDVADNFLDSAWYFLRYPSTEFQDRPFDRELTEKWLPVDMYIGGAEHSVLHLLYSRFIIMALHDLGLLSFEEPYVRFRAHGLLTKDGSKMSKSHGNVVNPDEYIERLGADTLRMYLMFLGPFEQGGDFSDLGIGGLRRFLNRVWDLVNAHADRLEPRIADITAARTLHRTIQKVTDDLANLKYNTAIAALMSYLNTLQGRTDLAREELTTLVLLLAPFAPHITEELWQRLGGASSVHRQRWPSADPELLRAEEVTVAIQVNGKTRGVITLPAEADQQQALEAARAVPAAQHALSGTVRRVVYVPGRILNILN